MEEILRDLMKTTLERGPQNKQFYTNLCITKSLYDNIEIQSKLESGVKFLQTRFKNGRGFQSKLYTNRNCAIEYESVTRSNLLSFSESNVSEVLTSVLTLDVLFNTVENETYVESRLREIICNFSNEVVDQLQSFIVPSCGLSTFNLFKQNDSGSPVVPSPSPPPVIRDAEGIDSGNDSPISMHTFSSSPEQSSTCQSIVNLFPDDIGTSMLSLSTLLHQGVIQKKPVESVLSWIVSNVFQIENHDAEKAEQSLTLTPVPFPTFVNQQGSSDPVAIANTLNLLYHLDISHETLVVAAEEFLMLTLEDAINSASSSSGVNLLGNTQNISSHSLSNYTTRENDEAIKTEELLEPSFILHHNSLDSLLYFLSRTLAQNNGTVTSTCRRPNISEMNGLLLELLDIRLGTTMNCCDLAMRILTGVYLGVVTPTKHGTDNLGANGEVNRKNGFSHNFEVAKLLRIRNLLQREFELLLSLQDERDGSWQADSLVTIGYENYAMDLDDTEKGSLHDIENIVYLGGKEISTIFAIKAISVYLTAKRTSGGDSDSQGDWISPKCDEEQDVDLHKMY